MQPKDFCYWLQGHFELAGDNYLTTAQVEMIKDHLKLVFEKETKDMEDFLGRMDFSTTISC